MHITVIYAIDEVVWLKYEWRPSFHYLPFLSLYIIKNYFTNKLLWSYLTNIMLCSSSFGCQKESSCLLEYVLVEPNPEKMTKIKQYIFAEAK